MVFTAETHNNIKGNRKAYSVVVPPEYVLCMNTYSTTGWLNMSSAQDIRIVTMSQ